MWRQVLNWVLDFLSHFEDFVSWLFTPVNVNIASSALNDFYSDMNDLGLSNVPTWLYSWLASSSQPIYVAPINILSISFLSIIFAVMVIKFFVS